MKQTQMKLQTMKTLIYKMLRIFVLTLLMATTLLLLNAFYSYKMFARFHKYVKYASDRIKTIKFPVGRVNTPSFAISRHTLIPTCCLRGQCDFDFQSCTNSTPATKPMWRTSPTKGDFHKSPKACLKTRDNLLREA